MRAQAGQSTLEYLALVLLVVLLLGAGAAGLAASGIAGALVAQVHRALCIVAGGGCRSRDAPCLVASETATSSTGLRVAFVRLGGGQTVIRERRSDGSERLTVASRAGVGLGLVLGGSLRVGGRTVGTSIAAEGSGVLARSRTWHVSGRREADELLRRLAAEAVPHGRADLVVRHRPPPPRPPDVVVREHGLDAALRGALGRIGLALEAEDVLGLREDRLARTRTVILRRRNGLVGTLGLLGRSGGSAEARSEERIELTFDGAGAPRELAVVEARRLHSGAQLPGLLDTAIGGRAAAAQSGRLVAIERRLDLSDPRSLAAAGAYVRALRDPPLLKLGDAVAVTDALHERLEAAGAVRARVYALRLRRTGGGGGLSAGAGLGGQVDRTLEQLELVAAADGGPGGVWRERADCLR